MNGGERVSFDPSTNAAQLAALVARCFPQPFTVSVVSTSTLNGQHPYQPQFYVAPPASRNVAVSFSCTYRGIKVSQPPLICNSTQQALATAAVLDAATNVLNTLDLRADFDGVNPNAYAPSRANSY